MGESKGKADRWAYLLVLRGSFLNLLKWAYFCSAVFSRALAVRPVIVLSFFCF